MIKINSLNPICGGLPLPPAPFFIILYTNGVGIERGAGVMKPAILATIGVILMSIVLGADAAAAPGAAIMTAGAEARRVSMTAGVSHKSVSGVNIYRGAPAAPPETDAAPLRNQPAGEAVMSQAPGPCVFRSFRRLRTQGFYSGDRHPSRQFVQGFYSGRWKTRSGPR